MSDQFFDEATSIVNMPAETDSCALTIQPQFSNEVLQQQIDSLKADLLNRDERLKEAALEIRAAVRNRARLEEEIKALVRKEKARTSDLVKLCKENATLTMQMEWQRLAQSPTASTKLNTTDVLPKDVENKGVLFKELDSSDSSQPQDLQEKLDACLSQMARFQLKMNEAAKGWETCEANKLACTGKIEELERELASSNAKIREQDALLSEHSKVHSRLSAKISEETEQTSSLKELFAQDLAMQSDREKDLRQQLMQATLQFTLVKDHQDSSIRSLTEEAETLTALLSSEKSRCESLEAHLQILAQQFEAAQKSRDRAVAERADMSSRCMVLEGLAAALETDLVKTLGQLRVASDIHHRLSVMCAGEDAAMQRKLQEELDFCLSLMEQHRQKLKKASDGWTYSEEKAAACESKLAEQQQELQAALGRLAEKEAEAAALRDSSEGLLRQLGDAQGAAEGAARQLDQARVCRDNAQVELERVLRQCAESQASWEAQADSFSSQLATERSESARLQGLLAETQAELAASQQRCLEAIAQKSDVSARCVLVEEVASAAHAQLEVVLEQLRSAEKERERLRRVLEGREYLNHRALEEQLEQSMAQAQRFQEKLRLAAIGWETCEAKVDAYKQRVADLEGQLEATRIRVSGLEDVVQELQNLNAVISSQLAEAIRPAQTMRPGQQSKRGSAAECRSVPRQVHVSGAARASQGSDTTSRRMMTGSAQTVREEFGQVAKSDETVSQLQLRFETLAAAYDSSEKERAKLEKDRGELVMRCRLLEQAGAETKSQIDGRMSIAGGGSVGDQNKSFLLLEQEVERMKRELESRNAVESQLRAELFHVNARLSKIQEDLEETIRSDHSGELDRSVHDGLLIGLAIESRAHTSGPS